jgi:hypothetical protein
VFSVRSAKKPLSHGVRTVDNPCRVSLQKVTGWILGSRPGEEKPVYLCWLPTERRGNFFTVYGSTMVVGARTGAITILDLSAVLAMLDQTLISNL